MEGGALSINYIGCYRDNNPDRELPTRFVLGGSNSVSSRAASCATHCADFLYFGLQSQDECFCGNTFGAQGAAAGAECGLTTATGYAALCANGENNCQDHNAIYEATISTVPPYFDTQSGAVDHWLINNDGHSRRWPFSSVSARPPDRQSPVAYSPCAAGTSELGFRTFYAANGQLAGGGLTDGDVIGVIGDTSTAMNGDGGQGGAAPHGSQYFALEGTGGFAHVSLDRVQTAAYVNVRMTGWVHIEATAWGGKSTTNPMAASSFIP